MSFTVTKSSILSKNTVVLITFANVKPWLSNNPWTFFNDWWACASIPSGISPVSGTNGICPEKKYISPTLIPWLYGPIAPGALSVFTTFFIFNILLKSL